jgi:putative resolvase
VGDRAGVHPQAAYRWFREGTLPVPAVRVGPRTILVNPEAVTAPTTGGVGLYARVSSHDQKVDLERQVARLSGWAAVAGLRVVRVESEVDSDLVGDCDLVGDVVEVLTSFCARRYGRRSARDRAERALACAAKDPV